MPTNQLSDHEKTSDLFYTYFCDVRRGFILRHHTVRHTIARHISRNTCLTKRLSVHNAYSPTICKPHFLSAPPCKAFFSTRRQRAIKSVATCPTIGAEATLPASVAGDTRKHTFSPLITGHCVHCDNCSDHWDLSLRLAERTPHHKTSSTLHTS